MFWSSRVTCSGWHFRKLSTSGRGVRGFGKTAWQTGGGSKALDTARRAPGTPSGTLVASSPSVGLV